MKRLNHSGIAPLLLTLAVALLLTAGGAKADFTFGEPVNLGPVVNGPSSNELFDCISPDGLEMYSCSDRAGGYGDYDLWVLRRTSIDKDWSPPENLGPGVNSSREDSLSCISADGLTLYFTSSRSGGYGQYDIYLTKRATKNSPWGPAVNAGPPINSSTIDGGTWVSTDGLEFYFGSYRGGYVRCDIYVARRATESDPWGAPVNLGSIVNSAYEDQFPSLSPDGLLLFLSDHNVGLPRPGGYGSSDMYVSRRPTTQGSWGAPVNLGPRVNGPYADHGPRVSPDGRTLYFESLDRPGGYGGWDLWQARIVPTVDFNGDETVDIDDLVILIEHWGQADPQCDIGPLPWGDGTVDAKDLEVLMRYWQHEVLPASLIAYWKLDEVEGVVAADSAGISDGTVVGNPIWRPAGGKHAGAFEFDGLGSCVKTPFVCSPSQGAFSVFAWVKGGAPGQVIVSQVSGANWLMLAPNGALMTELRQSGRQGKPLTSAAGITDGAWHRVGLVWDGSSRILYVDDIEVAKDTQTGLANAFGGLYLGAGSVLVPGSFFSGLIDDVRIYDRAAKP